MYGGEAVDNKSFCKIKSQEDLFDTCVQVLCMVPPFRNFTTRLFCRLIRELRSDFELSPNQKKLVEEAYSGVIQLILANINKNGPDSGMRLKE